MSKSVEDTRRELFEHAVKRDWLESMICFQCKADGYADRDIDNAWWAFNAALDCVGIELPYIKAYPPNEASSDVDYWIDEAKWEMRTDCRTSIESLNLGLKIK